MLTYLAPAWISMFNLVKFLGWKKVMVKLQSLMLQTRPENVANICINELCLKKAITLFPVLNGSPGNLGGRGALFVETGFYADISWESRCNIEINV